MFAIRVRRAGSLTYTGGLRSRNGEGMAGPCAIPLPKAFPQQNAPASLVAPRSPTQVDRIGNQAVETCHAGEPLLAAWDVTSLTD